MLNPVILYFVGYYLPGYYILELNYTNPSLGSLNTKSPLSILVILFWLFLGKINNDLAVRLFDDETLIVLAN